MPSDRKRVFSTMLASALLMAPMLSWDSLGAQEPGRDSKPGVGQWTKITTQNTPSARWGSAALFNPSDGAIYVFGGAEAVYSNNQVWRFWPGNRTWERLNSTGSPNHHQHQAVYYNDTTAFLWIDSDVWAFSFTNFSFSIFSSAVPPFSIGGYDIDREAGVIYTVSGRNWDKGVMEVFCFSIANRTWTKIPSANEPPEGWIFIDAAYSKRTNELFFYGGWNDRTTSDRLYRFSLDNRTWDIMNTASGPGPRTEYSMQIDEAQGKIYLFGGHQIQGPFYNTTWEYDVDRSTWKEIPATQPPQARVFPAMVLDEKNATIVIFGGSTAYEYDVHVSANDTWSLKYLDLPPSLARPIPEITLLEDNITQGMNVLQLADYFSDDFGAENLDYGVDYQEDQAILEASIQKGNLSINSKKPDWSGSLVFRASAKDAGNNECKSNNFTVRVAPVNDPPVIRLVANKNTDKEVVDLEVLAGTWFNASVVAYDIDGEALSYAISPPVPGFNVNATSGNIAILPPTGLYGKLNLTLTVTDINGSNDSLLLRFFIQAPDTDNDSLPDPLDADDDNDSLSDTAELANGTDPLKADTDGDGKSDSQDVYPLDRTKWKEAPVNGKKSGMEWAMLLTVATAMAMLVANRRRSKRGI